MGPHRSCLSQHLQHEVPDHLDSCCCESCSSCLNCCSSCLNCCSSCSCESCSNCCCQSCSSCFHCCSSCCSESCCSKCDLLPVPLPGRGQELLLRLQQHQQRQTGIWKCQPGSGPRILHRW